jgi:DNA-directed RNA polymerase specialized sigma24 family protein
MEGRARRREELAAAVAALLAADAGERELSQAELERLLGAANGFLQATLGSLSSDERVEVCDGALLELLERSRAERLDPDRDPAGLFLTIVHRRGIDLLRSARRRDLPLDEAAATVVEPGEQPAEEEVLLDALASKEQLAAMMRELARQGRHDLLAVVRVWLDLDEQVGAASSPLVAERLLLDRSTVNRRIAEIRRLLGQPDSS